jgi:hypothetical protein
MKSMFMRSPRVAGFSIDDIRPVVSWFDAFMPKLNITAFYPFADRFRHCSQYALYFRVPPRGGGLFDIRSMV